MQDKITGLWWSKKQPNGAWNTAWSTCLTTLNTDTYQAIEGQDPPLFNSVAGYNRQTGWRLPTQKELLDAYNHGIRSAASNNWIIEEYMYASFWSGSSLSNLTGHAWVVGLASGVTVNVGKLGTGQVVCVR